MQRYTLPSWHVAGWSRGRRRHHPREVVSQGYPLVGHPHSRPTEVTADQGTAAALAWRRLHAAAWHFARAAAGPECPTLLEKKQREPHRNKPTGERPQFEPIEAPKNTRPLHQPLFWQSLPVFALVAHLVDSVVEGDRPLSDHACLSFRNRRTSKIPSAQIARFESGENHGDGV